MIFQKLSEKQKQIFRWCYQPDSYALICDGSVRSGKTAAMSCSFVHWAMSQFDHQNFAFCGNTVQATERNILMTIQQMTDITYYYTLKYIGSKHVLTISGGGHENYFYIFGGKDESSYKLVQGITLDGILFDEVALQPESFVNQAIARTLSVENAKLWFNCNPDSPEHWFYKQWILQTDAGERPDVLHLHFEMQDNPIMTPEKIAKTTTLYSGVFYDRYIKGLWVLAEGLVYGTVFDKNRHVIEKYDDSNATDYYISIDYGTLNPCSMGLWALEQDKAVRIREYYHDGRKKGVQLTDEEYYAELEKLGDGYPIRHVIIDPSASSFIATIKRHGKFRIRKANNSVIDGIRNTMTLLEHDKILICECCKDIIREFSLYRWDDKKSYEKDTVIKENDHAMDDMRYFVNTAMSRILRKNLQE
ncbi:MAG: PBSX family phage terminase large subunit [Oscillospiraceae bacterium]|nr:PBSX family phage terminase large subunit [Oscillospiraceae bacterium]